MPPVLPASARATRSVVRPRRPKAYNAASVREPPSEAARSAAAGPPSVLRRDLRFMLGDGIAFSLMVGAGETYVPAFAMASGLSEVAAGLVATLPMLAGAFLQLLTPVGVVRLGSYRRWVVGCAVLQALSFAPLVGGSLAGGVSDGVLFAAMAVYWGAGMATGPAWNVWVSSLVPYERRAGFFAHRTRLAQAALFLSIVATGAVLHEGAALGRAQATFALVFTAAAGFRLVSALFLAHQSEPAGLWTGHRRHSAPGVWRILQGTEGRRLLVYLVGMQAAVQLASPYFTPYMLGPLELSYREYTILIAAAFVARIVVLPFFGRWAYRSGSRALFRLGAIGIVPLPALWLLSDDFFYLLGLQLAAGTVWAALELATLLSFFETLEERDRASILTLFNLANTVAMVLGTLGGGAILYGLSPSREVYALLFLGSSAARLFVLLLLPRPPAATHVPRDVTLRTLAVRPSAGAIQRPILPTLEEDPER